MKIFLLNFQPSKGCKLLKGYSLFFLHLLDERFDFCQFIFRRRMIAQRLHDELHRRAFERRRDEMIDEVALRFLLRQRGGIYVRTGRIVASQQAFFVHDLHRFERGGVAAFAVAFAVQNVVDEANGLRPVVPENVQNR